MHTKIFSAVTVGVDARLVEVEVDLAFGMLQFHIVGLPDTAIKESKQRIYTALKNCGFRLPERKITVNLAPADLKKEGTLFDLPIALGILSAGQVLSINAQFLHETLFLGELSLDGSIRPIKGALAIASDAHKLGKKRLIIPSINVTEASFIKDIEVLGFDHLVDLVAYIRGEKPYSALHTASSDNAISYDIDFEQVKGQQQAKRALQIAAAGRHHILFIGPPGAGKSMLAQRLPTIMPPMAMHEIIETSKIYSVSGKLGNRHLVRNRPFCSPHHTISPAGLVGGGSVPQPGDISLAHHGILFLDELTEFKRTTLELLRQPLENKTISISRAQQALTFPASFLLVAALNPCPCGYLGDKKRTCHCSETEIKRYLEKLSGPLLDRIDLQIHVQSVSYETITHKEKNQNSRELFSDVAQAVKIQEQRFKKNNVFNNSMTPDQIEQWCILSAPAQEIIKKAFDHLHLSMRGYHKILKVARTIADLDGAVSIEVQHLQEAIMYRSLDQYLEKLRTS